MGARKVIDWSVRAVCAKSLVRELQCRQGGAGTAGALPAVHTRRHADTGLSCCRARNRLLGIARPYRGTSTRALQALQAKLYTIIALAAGGASIRGVRRLSRGNSNARAQLTMASRRSGSVCSRPTLRDANRSANASVTGRSPTGSPNASEMDLPASISRGMLA